MEKTGHAAHDVADGSAGGDGSGNTIRAPQSAPRRLLPPRGKTVLAWPTNVASR